MCMNMETPTEKRKDNFNMYVIIAILVVLTMITVTLYYLQKQDDTINKEVNYAQTSQQQNHPETCTKVNYSDMYFVGFIINYTINGTNAKEYYYTTDGLFNHSGKTSRQWLEKEFNITQRNITVNDYDLDYISNGCLDKETIDYPSVA